MFCAPAKFQYTVLGAGKVIPELPPQSPKRVPDSVPTAPASAIFLKSTSAGDADHAATVNVVTVALDPEFKKTLRTGDAPEQVRVPLTTAFAVMSKARIPAVGAVMERLLNVPPSTVKIPPEAVEEEDRL
jgi:hypothetical protein